jgi:hypothetical protein
VTGWTRLTAWLSRPIPTFMVTALFAVKLFTLGGLLSMVAGMIAAVVVARWRNLDARGPRVTPVSSE